VSEIRSEPSPGGDDVDMAASGVPGSDVTSIDTGNRRWPLFLGLAALIVVADQLTKAWLVSFLPAGQSINVIGDVIRLVHSQNNGGLFGLLRGQAAIFGLVSLVVVGLIILYHARSAPSQYVSITLGLLLGGAIGNAIDRLRLGYVVDFVDAGIGALRWYTFNVADAGISFAIILLLVASVWPALTRTAADRG